MIAAAALSVGTTSENVNLLPIVADRHRSVVPWAWCKPKLAKARPLHFFKVKHHKIRQFKQVLLKGVIGTTAEHQQLTIVPDQSN